jgi:antitoxin FitA
MGMLTVRNLDDAVKAQLRVQAAQNGWAVEEEVRRILTRATLGEASTALLGNRIHARFKSLGSVGTPARSLACLAAGWRATNQLGDAGWSDV